MRQDQVPLVLACSANPDRSPVQKAQISVKASSARLDRMVFLEHQALLTPIVMNVLLGRSPMSLASPSVHHVLRDRSTDFMGLQHASSVRPGRFRLDQVQR